MQPLKWYFHRLRNMNAPELVHRVAELGKKSISRRRRHGWEDFSSAGAAPALPFLKQAVLANATPEMQAAVREATRRLLDGHLEIHGLAWPKRAPDDLFPLDFWRLDPVSGGLWSDAYCFDISYRHERHLGDVKYVWDANRLQFLQPLAISVALWSDADALRAIETAIESWSAANPPFRGVGWNSGIELALRAISLIFAASLCADKLTPAAGQRLRAILAAHLYWLRRYPSRFSSANNHLILELLGVYLIARALPDLPSARPIAEAAQKALERETLAQILPDGASAEQSPTYGAFAAEALLLAVLAARAGGLEFSAPARDRLASFADCIAWLADGSGVTPAIGDDDEGRCLTVPGLDEPRFPASVAAGVAGALDASSGLPDPLERSQIREAVFGAPSLRREPPLGLRTFSDGGFSVVRERRAGKNLFLVMDHGPLGYLSIAAHGHADANALILSLDDQPILVDPGTYLYHSGESWRDWFRGTRAHNTLNIAGVDQSLISGPFNWSHKAKARLETVRPLPDWSLVARHDGYVARFGVEHQRAVTATPNGVEILDRLLPAPIDSPCELVFQFAAGLSVTPDERGFAIAREGAALAHLRFDTPGEVEIRCGLATLDGGWVSPRFGEKIAAPRLSWQGKLAASGLRSFISWSDGGAS